MIKYFMPGSPLFYTLLAVDLVLRGMALYKSARKGQKPWFIALLVVNSMGILPLIYLLIEKKATPVATSTTKKLAKKGKK